jgi:alkaline phosphatase
MIGDGMGASHQIATSRYLYGTDHGLAFHGFPAQAFVTTYSVSAYNGYAGALGGPAYSLATWDPVTGYDPAKGGRAPYPFFADTVTSQAYFLPNGASGPCTDSAAAATAMATGYKTHDGVLSQTPDGKNAETIAETLRRLYGMSIGVVSTVPVSHATPAAFVAHNASRSNYQAIARELVNVTKPEVALGAGYAAANSYIGADNLATLEASPDYVYAHPVAGMSGAEALAAATTQAVLAQKKLFGLFGASSLEWPTPIHSPGAPAFTTTASDPALSQLATSALSVLAENPQGFFLMVEQGDIDLASHGNDFPHLLGNTWDLEEAVKTVLAYVDQPGDDVDWSNTTLFVVADHATGYLRLGPTTLGRGELPDATATEPAVTWGSGWHTNELVTLSATGAYAHRVSSYANRYPGTSIIDNTDIHSLLLDAALR